MSSCTICEQPVERGEGVTYPDGTRAHEECVDAEEFRQENTVQEWCPWNQVADDYNP